MQRFFRRSTEKLIYVGPQSEVDKLLAAGWVEVQNLDPTTDERRALKIAGTKAEAFRRILLIAGANETDWLTKELNLLLRGARLLKKLKDGTITATEQTELNDLDAKGAQIEATKDASNLIEVDIAMAADPASFDVVNSPRWP